ncbi:MAG: MotA/TolQ/ExbB proton channel family protein [Patulibacter minatonensis]
MPAPRWPAGRREEAGNILRPLGRGADASAALGAIVASAGTPLAEPRAARPSPTSTCAGMRRLERPRMLVRAGPALGLMGTLIPLSPALAGLARGDVQRLSDDLRTAFAVTVIGLLTGALAYGVALVRDRVYAQDLSDSSSSRPRSRRNGRREGVAAAPAATPTAPATRSTGS